MRLNGASRCVAARYSSYSFFANVARAPLGRLKINKPATCLGLASDSVIRKPRSRRESWLMELTIYVMKNQYLALPEWQSRRVSSRFTDGVKLRRLESESPRC